MANVDNVTTDNYPAKCKLFMKQNPDLTYCTIYRRNIEEKELGIKQDHWGAQETRRQWGAWLHYFLTKRIRCQLMGAYDYYCVPAMWPHEFDRDRNMQIDHRAGQSYVNLTNPHYRSGWLEPVPDGSFRKHTTAIATKERTTPAKNNPERTAFVIAELDYDPTKPRKERLCFIPPAPAVDISDFPDGITNPWADLTKP
jgi:hypothetical protein